MSILQNILAEASNEDSFSVGPIRSLLQTCVESASIILATLAGLSDNHQLGRSMETPTGAIIPLTQVIDCFIPFQLEEAFSSAFLLQVIAAVVPSCLPDRSHGLLAHHIFDNMIEKGSHGARIRKLELERLERLVFSYSRARSGELASSEQLNTPSKEVERLDTEGREHHHDFADFYNGVTYDNMADWNIADLQDSIGISPTGLMTLADGLNMEDFVF